MLILCTEDCTLATCRLVGRHVGPLEGIPNYCRQHAVTVGAKH